MKRYTGIGEGGSAVFTTQFAYETKNSNRLMLILVVCVTVVSIIAVETLMFCSTLSNVLYFVVLIIAPGK